MKNDAAIDTSLISTAPSLAATLSAPLAQNSAAVYLASLGAGSWRTMRTALNMIASLVGMGNVLDAEGMACEL